MTADAQTILCDVRQAILSGDYAQLPLLLPQLELAEAGLATRSPADLRALRAEAERVQTCLVAALSGMRAARRRVTDIAEAARGLTTYDRDGVKATLPAQPSGSRRL